MLTLFKKKTSFAAEDEKEQAELEIRKKAAIAEFWACWWAADYSWEGLAKKRFGRGKSLQDYWRKEEHNLITGPDGRKWTRFHVPLEWYDGEASRDYDPDSDTVFEAGRDKLNWSQKGKDDFVAELERRMQKARFWLKNINDDEFEPAYFAGIVAPWVPEIYDWFIYDDGPIALNGENAYLILAGKWRSVHFQTVKFNNAAFAGPTDLSGCAFEHSARFASALFTDDIIFTSSEFSDWANFYSSHCFGNVHFIGTNFLTNATFSNVIFERSCYFSMASFRHNAWFLKTKFNKSLKFTSASFLGRADFTGSEWPERKRDYFSAFKNVHFHKIALFEKIDFFAFSAFDGARFDQEVRFDDNVIYGDKRFENVIKRTADPKGAKDAWEKEVARRILKGEKNLSPTLSKFSIPEQDFLYRRYGEDLQPDAFYRGASQDYKPTGERSKDFKSNRRQGNLRALENGARALKISYENARDKLAEQRLYRLELLARKHQRKTNLSQRILFDVYQTTSSFGASMVRPLISVMTVLGVMGGIYALWALQLSGEELQNASIWEGLNFSARAVFRPFSAWSNLELRQGGFEADLIYQHGSVNKFIVRMVTTVQSFFSIAMLFLSGLAARRYFQM